MAKCSQVRKGVSLSMFQRNRGAEEKTPFVAAMETTDE